MRPLSRRQADVLQHAADGHGARETAALLRLSEQTVPVYLKQARERLGARSTCHAVALAWRKGWIK